MQIIPLFFLATGAQLERSPFIYPLFILSRSASCWSANQRTALWVVMVADVSPHSISRLDERHEATRTEQMMAAATTGRTELVHRH